MAHVATTHHGTVLVQGKTTYTFTLADGRKVTGAALIHDKEWPWRQSLHAPGCRYARLRAVSPTYGAVTLLLVDKPREERFYVFCLASDIPATRLLRVWSRRHRIDEMVFNLKHHWSSVNCQQLELYGLS